MSILIAMKMEGLNVKWTVVAKLFSMTMDTSMRTNTFHSEFNNTSNVCYREVSMILLNTCVVCVVEGGFKRH